MTIFLFSLLFCGWCWASTYVLKLPKNPSKESKFVPEGGKPDAISNALDVGHRFAMVGNELVEVAWTEDIRYLGVRHFEKLANGSRMWAVLFVSTPKLCKHCEPAILEYEATAREFKDFLDFGGVDALEQRDVCDWFHRRFELFVDRVPMLVVFRPAVARQAGQFEMLHYGQKIERGALMGAFTQMLPSRIVMLAAPPDIECLRGKEALKFFLAVDTPTLLALPKRSKQPPAFLKSISEDVHGVIAVHQITDELPDVCNYLVRRGLMTGARPALLLVRPWKTLVLEDKRSVDHFRIPAHDTMSHGAVRRWLDRAWNKIGMPGALNSAYLIPKYRDPKMLRTILEAENKAHADEAYNDAVDAAADAREQQELAEQRERAAAAAESPVDTEYTEQSQAADGTDYRDEL